MTPGDVLLFHRPTTLESFRKDPKGTLFTALIHLTTHSKWNHAAIAISDTHYAEATAGGVQITHLPVSDEVIGECAKFGGVSRIADPDGSIIQITPPPFDDDDDRLTAVAWAVARTGVRYGYFNAFMCGANTVLVGLGLVVKRTDAIICSELVAEALERAGYDFKKDSALVSPGDLADAFSVPR